MIVTPSEAAGLGRAVAQEMARRHLLSYIHAVNPRYQPAPHHLFMAGLAELVEMGVIGRIINELPPRHGKSQIWSVHYPAWHLGRHPDHEVISASYAQELSDDFSRKVRSQLRQDGWPWPAVKLAHDAYKVTEWSTVQGGRYRSAGRGAGITGKGANLLNLDDLLKDDEEARSPAVRDSAWRFLTTTAFPRLMPNAPVVLTNTRWHDDDPSGRLQSEAREGGEQWFVVTLPALSEDREVYAQVQVPDTLARHAGIAPAAAIGMEELLGRLRAVGQAQTEPER